MPTGPILASSIPNVESKIQIIATHSTPAQAILRDFYSTNVVNIISWNKAYAVYALSTYIQHRGYLFCELDDYFAGLVAKYSQRGWKIQDRMWPGDHRLNHPMREHRRVGDKYTWIIPLNISDVERAKIPDYVLEYAGFAVKTPEGFPQSTDDRPYSHYHIGCHRFAAHVLQYEYTYGTWAKFVGERTDRLISLELSKLKVADRPSEYAALMATPENYLYDRKFDKPSTWNYWDEEIPRWYRAWEGTESNEQDES